MSVTITERAFAPMEHSFVVSGMDSASSSMYVQYSKTPDFIDFGGNPKYGFTTSDIGTNQFAYNHLVLVDPAIAGPGDLVYWRLVNYSNGISRNTRTIRLKRPRSDQVGWNFVVGGSICGNGASADVCNNAKEFGVPTTMSLNPDFICIPGDVINGHGGADFATALSDYKLGRIALDNLGLNIPFYISPGNADLESQFFNKKSRTFIMPSSGIATDGSMVIRGPQIDPQQEDGSNAGSYYSFSYGNALFIFINDFWQGTMVTDITIANYKSMKSYVESVLADKRHKYKWCFTFTHTSVDESDPDHIGDSNSVAENLPTQTWLMNLHEEFKITAHFSGHYYGWRSVQNLNGTFYINSSFGTSTPTISSGTWHSEIAVANIRIGVDKDGNENPDYCKIDIVNTGVVGTPGDILNTDEDTKCSIHYFTDTIIDHNGVDQTLFNCNRRECLINLGSEWTYNSTSTVIDPTDFIISKEFMDTEFSPIIYDTRLNASDQKISWKTSLAPFYNGLSISKTPFNTSLGNFIAKKLTTPSSSLTNLAIPLSWQVGTPINSNPSNTPIYFLKAFDIPNGIKVKELQLIYELTDAAYIWINGKLAWFTDGEGMPDTTSPFTSTSRPYLNGDLVNRTSSSFAQNVISALEPAPNLLDSNNYAIDKKISHQRKPDVHYELQGQPIRINDIDVINSLRKNHNLIAVALLQGRDPDVDVPTHGSAAGRSVNLTFDLELVAFGDNANDLYCPQIITPKTSDQFNYGIVNIEWLVNNPSSKIYENQDPYF